MGGRQKSLQIEPQDRPSDPHFFVFAVDESWSI